MNLPPISSATGTANDTTSLTPESTSLPSVASNSANNLTTSATASAAPAPAPKAGLRTTQFWLLTGVLLLVAWMVFAGKLDAGWFAALAPIAALIYQSVRENLYRDASTHPNDALNAILETVLGQLPEPSSADATAVIHAFRHGPATASTAPASTAGAGSDTPKSSLIPTAAALSLAGITLLSFSGCAQTPYYVSGINGTVDASKDGSRITGGGLGVTISPNPNFPLPKTHGLSK